MKYPNTTLILHFANVNKLIMVAFILLKIRRRKLKYNVQIVLLIQIMAQRNRNVREGRLRYWNDG